MFAWYCKYNHKDWFDSFIPEEMHIGDYFWTDDIEEKWQRFIQQN